MSFPTPIQTDENDVKPKTVDNAVIEEIWLEARLAANLALQNYTLADISEKRDSRRHLDIMYYI